MVSRKYKMGLIVMMAIIAVMFVVMVNPIFLQVIDTIVGGLVTVYGIYCGLNVANKWAVGKQVTSKSQNDKLPQIKGD